jgi:hypothetical protein
MAVEVKNLQNGEAFAIGPEGSIFGREGGPANIKVADQSVSKRHARIFSDGTEWFLEDMGSVNGTLVDGNKIAGVVALRPGLIFQMSKFRFEVVTIDGRGGRAAPAMQAGPDLETRTAMRGGQGNAALPSDLRKDPIPKKRAQPSPPPRLQEDLEPPTAQSNGRNNNLPLASDQDFPSQSLAEASQQSLPDLRDDGPAPVLGIDQYEDLAPPAALAAGIGYVLKTAPLLVLNPLGTLRKQIESPPVVGLEKIPLAAFLFPTYAVLLLAQSWLGFLIALIGGSFDIVGLILGPVIAVIGGAIGAAIAGFLSHPILQWLVDKLGGTSDARSRTSHIAMGMVTALVMLVPTIIGGLMTALVARLASVSSVFWLLNIIPALISIVALPIPIAVQWAWFRSYGVVKAFQTFLLVVAVLATLGGLASAIMGVLAAVNGMRGAGSMPSVPNVPVDPNNPVAAVVDAGVLEVPDPPANPDTPTNPTPTNPTPTNPTPTNPTPANPTPTNPTNPTPTNPTPTNTTTTTAVKGGSELGRKRRFIEEALDNDPLLLTGEVDTEYQQLSKRIVDAEEEAANAVFGNARKRDPEKRLYFERVKQKKIAEKAANQINKLYRLLGGK